MLYGTRYIKNLPAQDLIVAVNDKLPFFDFEEAVAWYNEFRKGKHNAAEFAFLACNDRFFLLTALLGRRDALHPWIYDRCREVENEPDGCLDLWARYHYKSTIGTFAGIIQEVIRDPELTVCIFSHTRDIAQGFLRQLKRELETNPALHTIFPDVFYPEPKLESPKWSELDGLVVKRKGNPKEASVEAWGLVDGQPTSKHFGLLVYDDVVTKKSVTTPEMVKKTTESWELSDNLGIGERTRKWHYGTRYSFADTYQELIDRKLFKVRLYGASHNGKATGEPVFLSKKQWKHIKSTQRSTFAAQMLQNPSEGSTATFELGWLKSYEVRPEILNVYILVDPSGGKKRTSDRTAMAVIGVDSRLNKYLLDGYRHRMKLSERWDLLLGLHKKWSKEKGVQFVYVGYERYGMLPDVEQMLEWMTRDKYDFAIEELNWSGPDHRSKRDRIERLQPDIEGTREKFYFPNIVYHDGIGVCTWKHNDLTNQIDYELAEIERVNKSDDGKVVPIRTSDVFLTKNQLLMQRLGTPWRVARPIKRIDEENQLYDVTRAFFEEMRYFPFREGHDDLIDAVSRIYDMKPSAPVPWENVKPAAPVWQDR
jgi:hypothetical protein